MSTNRIVPNPFAQEMEIEFSDSLRNNAPSSSILSDVITGMKRRGTRTPPPPPKKAKKMNFVRFLQDIKNGIQLDNLGQIQQALKQYTLLRNLIDFNSWAQLFKSASLTDNPNTIAIIDEFSKYYALGLSNRLNIILPGAIQTSNKALAMKLFEETIATQIHEELFEVFIEKIPSEDLHDLYFHLFWDYPNQTEAFKRASTKLNKRIFPPNTLFKFIECILTKSSHDSARFFDFIDYLKSEFTLDEEEVTSLLTQFPKNLDPYHLKILSTIIKVAKSPESALVQVILYLKDSKQHLLLNDYAKEIKTSRVLSFHKFPPFIRNYIVNKYEEGHVSILELLPLILNLTEDHSSVWLDCIKQAILTNNELIGDFFTKETILSQISSITKLEACIAAIEHRSFYFANKLMPVSEISQLKDHELSSLYGAITSMNPDLFRNRAKWRTLFQLVTRELRNRDGFQQKFEGNRVPFLGN